jgi:hypothetical protein
MQSVFGYKLLDDVVPQDILKLKKATSMCVKVRM